MIDEGLRGYLLSFPGVTAEVDTRIYPAPLPQDVHLPAITYTDIDDVPDHTGPEGVGAYQRLRYQFDHWATTRVAAGRIERVTRAVLDGFRGTIGGHTIGAILRINSFLRHEPETGLWRMITDYSIHITQ